VLDYLRQIESYYPAWYNQQTLDVGLCLYVRNLMRWRPEKAMRLLDEAGLEQLNTAVGWLWQVLLDAPGTQTQIEDIRRLVNNRAVETAEQLTHHLLLTTRLTCCLAQTAAPMRSCWRR
jgi:hypothetical protein